MAATTLYLIAYDIPNDRRRTKIHKTLEGYGRWTQYSLFECHLTRQQFIQLRHDLTTILKGDADNLRIYPICVTCNQRIETFGSEPPHDDPFFLI